MSWGASAPFIAFCTLMWAFALVSWRLMRLDPRVSLPGLPFFCTVHCLAAYLLQSGEKVVVFLPPEACSFSLCFHFDGMEWLKKRTTLCPLFHPPRYCLLTFILYKTSQFWMFVGFFSFSVLFNVRKKNKNSSLRCQNCKKPVLLSEKVSHSSRCVYLSKSQSYSTEDQ